MQFDNTFTVDAPVGRVWDFMLNVQEVAPCVPGAQLTEVVSETEYKGTVKVKVGPVQMTYRGTVVLKEVDEASHRVVMSATGNDVRGSGNVSGTISSTMTEEGGGRTKVIIHSDVNVTGRVAQFGRNIMQDVSARLIREMAQCIERKITEGGQEQEPSTAATVDESASGAAEAAATQSASGPDLADDTTTAVGTGETTTATPAPTETPSRSSMSTTASQSSSGTTSAPSTSQAVSAQPSPAAGSTQSSSSTGSATSASASQSQSRSSSQTPPMGQAPYSSPEAEPLKVLPLVLDITRSQIAAGLRKLAHVIEPKDR